MHYWPFVRGIHQSPAASPYTRRITRWRYYSFVLSPWTRPNKQVMAWLFKITQTNPPATAKVGCSTASDEITDTTNMTMANVQATAMLQQEVINSIQTGINYSHLELCNEKKNGCSSFVVLMIMWCIANCIMIALVSKIQCTCRRLSARLQ